MKTTEDQRRNLEVALIDRTQPVQFHHGWRYVVWPPQNRINGYFFGCIDICISSYRTRSSTIVHAFVLPRRCYDNLSSVDPKSTVSSEQPVAANRPTMLRCSPHTVPWTARSRDMRPQTPPVVSVPPYRVQFKLCTTMYSWYPLSHDSTECGQFLFERNFRKVFRRKLYA